MVEFNPTDEASVLQALKSRHAEDAWVKLIQLLDIRLWGVWMSGNIPCIAHTELKPVGIWCVANRHILECAILNIAWGGKPLHIPSTIAIKVEVNVAIATFRTAANRNICQFHLVWSCTEWSRCLIIWPYNLLGSALYFLGIFLTRNIFLWRALKIWVKNDGTNKYVQFVLGIPSKQCIDKTTHTKTNLVSGWCPLRFIVRSFAITTWDTEM